MARKYPKLKAWLVTWEWIGEHAKRDETVVAVFSARLGAQRVKELVEFLYMTHEYTVGERIACVLGKKPNPYPAEFGSTPEGVPWTGEVICGHNPFLQARLVDDLMVELNSDGGEKVTWKERPKPWEIKVGIWREGATSGAIPESSVWRK